MLPLSLNNNVRRVKAKSFHPFNVHVIFALLPGEHRISVIQVKLMSLAPTFCLADIEFLLFK